MTSCPICEARADRKAIEVLVEEGGDLEAVKKALEDRGIKSSTYMIRRHFRDHTKIPPEKIHASLIPKIKPTKAELEAQAAERESRRIEVEAYLDEVASINLEKVFEATGVNPKVESMGDVLDLVQRMAISLHTLTTAIAYDRLERYARDPEGRRYPTTEVRGAQATAGMVSEAFGYGQAVSLQTAADTIERAGLRVVDLQAEPATLPPEVAAAEES